MSIGFNLIFGVMKIVNISHGALIMLGAYTTYWLFTLSGIDPYLSLVIVVPLFIGIGVLFQRYLINRVVNQPMIMPLLLTFGILMIIQNSALFFWLADDRSVTVPYSMRTIDAFGVPFAISRTAAFIVSLALSAGVYLLLRRTFFGKAMRATAHQRDAAVLMGVNVNLVYLETAGMSAALAGAAGSLIATLYSFTPLVALPYVLKSMTICVAGGLGSFHGAFICGLLLGILEAFSMFFLGGWTKDLVFYLVLILILLVKPSGLFAEM